MRVGNLGDMSRGGGECRDDAPEDVSEFVRNEDCPTRTRKQNLGRFFRNLSTCDSQPRADGTRKPARHVPLAQELQAIDCPDFQLFVVSDGDQICILDVDSGAAYGPCFLQGI